MTTLNQWAVKVYDLAKLKGWHTSDPDVAKYLMNLHSEVSEAWEAWRKGRLHSPCDKTGTGLTCLEEELADIIIRALDTAQAFGINIERAVEAKHAYNATREHRHGGKLA